VTLFIDAILLQM